MPTQYAARRKYLRTMQQRGTPVMVPADPARDRLILLRQYMELREIAALTGIPAPRLSKIQNHNKMCRRADVCAILALPVPSVRVVDLAHGKIEWRQTAVPRILRGLSRAGYPTTYLAQRLGTTEGVVSTWRGCGRDRDVVPGIQAYERIAALGRELEATSPAACEIDPRITAVVQGRATARGYAPLTAWDWDTIGDPAAEPEWTGACGTPAGYRIHRRDGIPLCERCRTAHARERRERKGGAPAEESAASGSAELRAEEIQHLAAFGVTDAEIARRVRCSTEYVRAQLAGWRAPGQPRAKATPKPLHPLWICEVCGTSFRAPRRGHGQPRVTCSPECKDQLMKARRKTA
jgi:DNA-binding CsgD family transcriptional regulator